MPVGCRLQTADCRLRLMTFAIHQAVEMSEGAGARVRRLFPVPRGLMNFDPFVLWDNFRIAAGAGFPMHSHRGFEAVSYLFQGAMTHEDSLGNRSTVLSEGAQRFTAGRGITHSEMPGDAGATTGIQLWINLPKRLKSVHPAYQQADADQLPCYEIDSGRVRVIVGEGSPVELKTPVRYLDIRLKAGGQLKEIIPDEFRGFVYMAEGQADISDNEIDAGGALLTEGGTELLVTAKTDLRCMCCFGQPHGEPILQHGGVVD